MPHDDDRNQRVRAALALAGQQAPKAGERPAWYRVGEVRAETVGQQTPSDGETSAESRTTADVYVFDRIGGWFGVSADDFVRDVASLDVEHLNLHLNSPGGDASEGVAIANVLRQHKADITVWVDGLAASAASVIAMAGDEVVMGVGSQLMIHDAWAMSIGSADDMRKAAAMLDSTSNALASTYAAKAGGTPADWRDVMVAESWYTAEEAVTAGLADRVATTDDQGSASGEQVVPGSSGGMWDLWDSFGAAERHSATVRAMYAHAGRDDAPPPRMPAGAGTPKTPAASAGGFTSTQEGAAMPTLNEGLRQRLGITAEDADESTILAALDEVLAEQADPAPVTKAALPEGTVAVDSAVFAQLRADASAGREAREEQQASRRTQLVNAAVADGRIAPASRDAWLNALKADPDGEKNLASLSAGLIPVAELGHASNDAATDTDFDDESLDALAATIGLQKGSLR
jgi:ATP-dependent protease ClpP protease subunit